MINIDFTTVQRQQRVLRELEKELYQSVMTGNRFQLERVAEQLSKMNEVPNE